MLEATHSSTEAGTTDAKGSSRGFLSKLYSFASGAVGAIAGITPHVLHHIGPIAGTALLTGTGGSIIFGAIGFLLTLPLLLKLKRRFNTWTAPGIALALFAIMFTISTLWIGPWIRGDTGGDESAPQDPHHARVYSGESASRVVYSSELQIQGTGR